MDETAPQFPQYQPPQPQTGPEHMHPKFSSPLYKLAKMMLKPKIKTPMKRMSHPKTNKLKKKRFY